MLHTLPVIANLAAGCLSGKLEVLHASTSFDKLFCDLHHALKAQVLMSMIVMLHTIATEPNADLHTKVNRGKQGDWHHCILSQVFLS